MNKKDPKHQAVKNMKRIAGFPFKTLSLIMGNIIITEAAEIQFAAVENGTILGSTISGIYNQTTGPSESPNTAINKNRPLSTKPCPSCSWSSRMKNPIDIIRQANPSKKDP